LWFDAVLAYFAQDGKFAANILCRTKDILDSTDNSVDKPTMMSVSWLFE
jgi:hypothetical protein